MGYMKTQQAIYAHLQDIATDNKKLWSYSGELSQVYISELKLKEHSKKSSIDLDNKEEITLRNIKLRIVKNDYSPIRTVGLNNIVLLLE